MTSELDHLTNAVAALGDRLAVELRVCEQVLKTEADVAMRRTAQSRFVELKNQMENAA